MGQDSTQSNAQRRDDGFTRRLVESCPAGILYLDAQGIITYENPAMRRIMGVPPGMRSPALGRAIADLPSIRQAGLLTLLERCRAGEPIAGTTARYESLMGAAVDVEIHATPLVDEDGVWEGAIIMAYDISQRLRAEREVQQRNRELALLNRVIAASATCDRIETLLEITCRELARAFHVPQAAAALLRNETTTAKAEAVVVAEYLAQGRPSGLGAVIPVANNASFQYLLAHKSPLVVDEAQSDPRLAPVRDLMRRRGTRSLLLLPLLIEGEVVGSLGLDAIEPRSFGGDEVRLAERVASQVSGLLARIRLEEDHQRLQEQFLYAHKMEALGQMAAGVAQDFNNLLTTIATTTQMLEQEIHASDPLREKVSRIAQAGQETAGLVQQLLRFARQEEVQPAHLDLNEAITAMQPMLGRILGPAGDLEIRLDEELWPILADPSQIDQVLVNLAMSARAAIHKRAGAEPGGRMRIETANVLLDAAYVATHLEGRLGEHVLLSVHDDGPALDEERLAHLFEPFYGERDEGAGLGLAAVYGIVKQNGGHIRVDSQVGQGTAIHIYWPRARAGALGPGSAGTLPAALEPSTETILVVEDEATVRRLIARVLQEQGYQVLTAEDGVDALLVSRTHPGPIHLLLTDVVMPRMKGDELARQLYRQRTETRVLYMSGYAEGQLNRPPSRPAGATPHDAGQPPPQPGGNGEAPPDFLAKPFSLDTLLVTVRHSLDG
ncbi:MAG: response regulator [Anaerolineae bacterium]